MRLTPALELHPEPVSGVTLLSYGILTRDMMEGCVSIFDAVWLERQCVRSALRQDFDGAYQRLASAGSWAHLYMRPTLEVMFLQYGQVDAAQLVQILSGERAVQGALEFAEDHAANQLPVAPDGRAVERCSTHAFKKALARAGIEREFRWHDLRHTWASWRVQSGTRLQELMELGSSSSYEMLLRYTHLATDHLRDAASRIDGTFTRKATANGATCAID